MATERERIEERLSEYQLAMPARFGANAGREA